MEGIDHIDVVEIRRRRFISHIDRVAQGQVPDREGLELGVTCFHAPAVLVIELGEAGGHLAAAGTRRRHNDEGAAGLNVVVAPVTVLADDQRNVHRVSVNGVMPVYFQAECLQSLFVSDGRRLVREAGQDNAAHIETVLGKSIDEP